MPYNYQANNINNGFVSSFGDPLQDKIGTIYDLPNKIYAKYINNLQSEIVTMQQRSSRINKDKVYLSDVDCPTDGVTSSVPAIKLALSKVAASRGTVIVNSCINGYVIDDFFTIPEGVALLSEEVWTVRNVYDSSSGPDIKKDATFLMKHGQGDALATPTITVLFGAALQGIRFFWPNQPRIAPPIEFPFAIALRGSDSLLSNLTFINCYQGIEGRCRQWRPNIHRIKGCFLKKGIVLDGTIDVAQLSDIFMSFGFWQELDISMIYWIAKNLECLELGRNDQILMDKIFFWNAKTGFKFTPSLITEILGTTTYGNLVNWGTDLCSVGFDISSVGHMQVVGGGMATGSYDNQVPIAIGINDTGSQSGKVTFTGTSFWAGPCTTNVLKTANSKVSYGFNGCQTNNWDISRQGIACFDLGGQPRLRVNGCEFSVASAHLNLANYTGTAKPIFTGNDFGTPISVLNQGAKTIIDVGNNIA